MGWLRIFGITSAYFMGGLLLSTFIIDRFLFPLDGQFLSYLTATAAGGLLFACALIITAWSLRVPQPQSAPPEVIHPQPIFIPQRKRNIRPS